MSHHLIPRHLRLWKLLDCASLLIICKEECNTVLRKEINSSVPLQQKPNMNEITTPIQAITLAQELEKTLTQNLKELKNLATRHRETDVSSSLILTMSFFTLGYQFALYACPSPKKAET